MRIISLDKLSSGFDGIIERIGSYQEFFLPINDAPLEMGEIYYKGEYGENHRTFAAEYQKFEPGTNFLEKPVEIDRLEWSELEKIWVNIVG